MNIWKAYKQGVVYRRRGAEMRGGDMKATGDRKVERSLGAGHEGRRKNREEVGARDTKLKFGLNKYHNRTQFFVS